MITINGYFFDGASSQSEPATVELGGLNTVRITKASGSFTIDCVDVRISSRLGNAARYIKLGDYGRFETRDNEAVDKLDALLGGSTNLLHKLESNLNLIIVAIFVTVAFVFAVVQYGIPAAADAIVDNIPTATQDIIDQKILNVADQNIWRPSTLSEARQAELAALFEQVKVQLDLPSSEYTFLLRKGGTDLGANALAFPSGTIVMTDELVELASDDKQIAGVMAHEIGHIDGQHSLRQIVRGSILTFVLAAIAGDVSGATAVIVSTPTLLLELQYSREFEQQADAYALRYFQCDVDGLALMSRFFLRLEEQQHANTDDLRPASAEETSVTYPREESADIVDFLSTHPSSSERMHMFKNHIQRDCAKS